MLCKFFRYILDFKVIDPTEATFTLASAAISVAERLLTSAVTYTSPDIYHGSAHTVSLDIRDKTSGAKLTDIAWSVSVKLVFECCISVELSRTCSVLHKNSLEVL